MKFLRALLFSCIFLFFSQLVFCQEFEIQKSAQALKSDEIFAILANNDYNPQKQLLENTLSEQYPYNIILSNDFSIDSKIEKKLIIVIPQEIVHKYIPQMFSLIEYIKTSHLDFSVDIALTANDYNYYEHENYNRNIFEGSSTYIQNLTSISNTAAIIVSPQTLETITTDIGLLNDFVKLSISGNNTKNKNEIVQLGFFSTIINSMAKADVSYYIEGVLLSLHKLNLIKGDLRLGTWLENDIPAVSVSINDSNSHKIFALLQSVLEEFPTSDFSNVDVNYGFLDIFSIRFFINETVYLWLFIITVTVILFLFSHVSFINGAHKNIHKKEIAETWYLAPIIIICTTLVLFLSQTIVFALVPFSSEYMLLAFIAKMLFTILIALLLSSLKYIFKFPITGFIYAYIGSISAACNIILFSLIEITLLPLFLIQFLIVQASQKVRNVKILIIYYIAMMFPFIPFIINSASSNEILQLESVTNAGIGINTLIAIVMLPFQIMTIRIFIRLKIWTTKLKFNPKKFITGLSILVFCLIVVTIVLIVVTKAPQIESSTKLLDTENAELIAITTHNTEKYGNISHTITLKTDEKVAKYEIELYSDTTLPIYSANYPFDILEKPHTAIFTLSENPPNPLIVEFLSAGKSDIICSITAWIDKNSVLEKVYFEKTIEAEK